MLQKLLLCLFAGLAFGDCETSTCVVCQNMTGCGWYGYDCLNTSSTVVKQLSLSVKPCEVCQAGSCTECQAQSNCTWSASSIPGVSGRCDLNGTSTTTYTPIATCPTCSQSGDCNTCNARQNSSGCSWFVLPGGIGGKCREAAPSFAYTQVPSGSCATGNPCAGILTCQACQNQNSTTGNCTWYTSKSPSIYDSKCDVANAGFVSSNLYETVTGSCPVCSGTSCVNCKAESGCQWAAVQGLTGIAFGQCLASTASVPTGKAAIATCPATCQVHTCQDCTKIADCRWYSGSSVIDDSCDLASDATLQHPTQTGFNQTSQCSQCMADRCFECDSLPGCGWYAEKLGFITIRQGCYPDSSAPSGRVKIASTDSKCDGAVSGVAPVAASFGLLAVISFLM